MRIPLSTPETGAASTVPDLLTTPARPAAQHGEQPARAECVDRQRRQLAGSQQSDDHAELLCAHKSGAEKDGGKCNRRHAFSQVIAVRKMALR